MYEQIFQKLQVLRGENVILDRDLAACLGLSTKRLNEQVKRHAERFPSDFRYRLSTEEVLSLPRPDDRIFMRGGRRYMPYAYTEAGALMAVLVVKTPTANDMSVAIIKDLMLYWSQMFLDDPPTDTTGGAHRYTSAEPDEDLECRAKLDRLVSSVLTTTRLWRAGTEDAATRRTSVLMAG